MITLFFSCLTAVFSPADSLRTETIDGTLFVIHRVGERETLYGLSKRYGASIPAILEHNPTADAGLEVGQLLRIPYTRRDPVQTVAGPVHRVAPKETLFSISRLYNVSVDDLRAWNKLPDSNISPGQELIVKKPAENGRQVAATGGAMQLKTAHVVEPGETLFAIAKKYNVSVAQLREWNGMTGNDLRVGQTLFLAQPMHQPVAVTVTPETQPAATTAPPKPAESTTWVSIQQQPPAQDEVKETGLAEVIEGSEGNRKYLAFHRTAKTGSIIKVKNELNGREVFVRVAGALPDTGNNDKVVIKISRSAYDRLGAIDARFRVAVTYYK
jgi:LysM repeat protein